MRLDVRTPSRASFIDVTQQVAEAVSRIGTGDGVVLVYCPHTTAAVTINENADPDVLRDLDLGFGRVAPHDAGYRHREGNSDGHIKSSLIGLQVMVPVQAGRMLLGTWQGIYLCEFDGPRARRLEVAVLPAAL